jgi:hypothetical protein
MRRRRDAATAARLHAQAQEKKAAERPAMQATNATTATDAAATPAVTDAATGATATGATAAGATAAGATIAAPASDAAATAVPPEGPPMALPAEPALEDLVRACNLSPSSSQRIDIIGKFRGIKNASVVAALRANATSAHPGVRAAAEQAMAALFGPNWNVVRAVPKPVQPPAGDDKDRGPPGSW